MSHRNGAALAAIDPSLDEVPPPSTAARGTVTQVHLLPVADDADLAIVVEGLLFVADQPVAISDLARAAEVDRREIEEALDDLAHRLAERGVRVQRDGGMVQLVSAPECAAAIQRFLGLEASAKLSKAALETLAIVAYEQPVTRPEIDQLRGVNSDGVLRTLLARGLVEDVGRRETVGLPVEYGTTFLFLEYFGLPSLDALPPVEDFTELAQAAAEQPTELDPEPSATAATPSDEADLDMPTRTAKTPSDEADLDSPTGAAGTPSDEADLDAPTSAAETPSDGADVDTPTSAAGTPSAEADA